MTAKYGKTLMSGVRGACHGTHGHPVYLNHPRSSPEHSAKTRRAMSAAKHKPAGITLPTVPWDTAAKETK